MENLPVPREIDFREIGGLAVRFVMMGEALYVDVQDADEGNFTLDAREAVEKLHLPENKTNNPAHVFKHPKAYWHHSRSRGGGG